MARLLAIDAGTTGVRAIVFDEAGAAHGAGYRELATNYPSPGHAEQDLTAVWGATREVIAEALAAAGLAPNELAGLAVSNQRSSIGAWDAQTLQPLAPMITWQDLRGSARSEELTAAGFFVTAGVAATKAEWLVNNVAAVREAAQAGRLRLGGVETWLCARLSEGLHVTDSSNASATGLYGHFVQTWDPQLLDVLGIEASMLPELVDSSGHIGDTSEAVFGARVPLAGLCGDQQASLFGLGCRESGQTKCSYGTAAMVDRNTAGSVELGGPGTYPLVAWTVDGVATWCVEGTVITAGAAVQWLRDGAGLVADAEETAGLAASVPDAGGVWAVPAFAGLGTPQMKPAARAVIGGLSRGSTKAHIARAVLEGVAQRVADVAETVWENAEPATLLRVDGGASRNDFLMQTQADILGLPIERSPQPDGAALGAAGLAAVALGIGEGDSGGPPWRPDRVFEPRMSDDEREGSRASWQRRAALVAADAD